MLYSLTERRMDLLHWRRHGALLFLNRIGKTGKDFDGTVPFKLTLFTNLGKI